nr:hypothetical protein [Tanacetum cinerariifolium]
GYKQSYFKGMKYEDIRPIFERKLDEQTEEEVEAQADIDQEVEEMKLYVKIVLDEDIAIDAIPLATKPPVIIEYKIVKEGKINTCHIIRADGKSSKKQKLDEQTEEEVEAQADIDQEVEEMKLYVKIVLDEDIAIDAIPLATKPPVIIEYKIVKEGKINTCHIIRADGSTKIYTSMIK